MADFQRPQRPFRKIILPPRHAEPRLRQPFRPPFWRVGVGMAGDKVKQVAVFVSRAGQPQPLKKACPAQIFGKQMAGHGHHKLSAGAQHAAGLVQHALDVGDVFQHRIAVCRGKGVVGERPFRPRVLQHQPILAAAPRLLQRPPPRVNPHLDGLVKRQLGKVAVATANVQHRAGKVKLLVKPCLHGPQQGAEGGQCFEMLPKQVVLRRCWFVNGFAHGANYTPSNGELRMENWQLRIGNWEWGIAWIANPKSSFLLRPYPCPLPNHPINSCHLIALLVMLVFV